MAVPIVLPNDVRIQGNISATTMTPIASSVNAASIVAGTVLPGNVVQAGERQMYTQPNTAATSETRVIHRVYGATCQIVGLYCGSIVVAIGAATVTFDLKKNGTSVLTGVLTINNANVAYVGVPASLAGTANGVAGDVYTIVTVATAGGGTLPTGIFAELILTEDPA